MSRMLVLPGLVCPQTHQPLSHADAALVDRLNAAAAHGRLKFHDGETVAERLDAGLLRADAQVLYPVIRGIPHLTIDRAISLDQLDAAE